jgi:serine/threonine-protein phosphatase 2A regulatory subunit A
MVQRLSKADWFTSKVSATGLYCVPYRKTSSSLQQTLRQFFAGLVRDETPMVRRSAGNNLAKFVKEMTTPIVIDEMIPLFQYLASDDQDSVRLLTVDILIAIAEEIPKEQQPSHGVLLTSLRSLFEDKSWRVRYMVADRYEKVSCGFLAESFFELSNEPHRLRKQCMKKLSLGTWCHHSLNF